MHRDVGCHNRLPTVKHAHRRAIERKVSHRVRERHPPTIDKGLDHWAIDIDSDLLTAIRQSPVRKEGLFKVREEAHSELIC